MHTKENDTQTIDNNNMNLIVVQKWGVIHWFKSLWDLNNIEISSCILTISP
jgi:hypothetical protein